MMRLTAAAADREQATRKSFPSPCRFLLSSGSGLCSRASKRSRACQRRQTEKERDPQGSSSSYLDHAAQRIEGEKVERERRKKQRQSEKRGEKRENILFF